MNERLKKYLKIAGLILVSFILLLEAVSLIIGSSIKKIIVSQINNAVTVPVKINGDIDFSLLAHFPYASVTFTDVDIKGSLPNDSAHLLKAKEVYLLFSIYNLFEKNYTIHHIAVKKGAVNFCYDETGKSNFDIFKSDTANKTTTTFYIKKLALTGVAVTYSDRQNNYYLSCDVKTGALAGSIAGTQFNFTTDINAFCNYITAGSQTYVKNKNLNLKSSLNYNSAAEKLSIASALATIETNAFNISGTVQSFDKYTAYDLAFAGKKLDLISVASLMSVDQAKYIYAYHSKGDFAMTGKITGNSSATTNPAVAIDFAVTDGELKNDNLSKRFKNISFTGNLTTGSSLDFHEARLAIKGLRATIDGEPITGNFILENFAHLYMDMQLNADIDLKNIYPLFNLNLVKDMYGRVDFENVYYKGSLSQLSHKGDINKVDAGGNIIIKNVTIVFDRNHLNHIDGNFKINNNETAVNNIRVVSGGTDMLFNGTIKNAVSAIFNAVNKKTKSDRVEIAITCTAKNINWDDLEVPSKQKDTIHFLPSFLNTFEGTLSAKIDHFTLGKFEAQNVNGTAQIQPDKTLFNNFSFNAIDGSVQGDGALNTSDLSNIVFETTSTLTAIDINKLFYSFDNFDQNEITDKNLQGVLTTKLFARAVWTNFKFNDSKLYVLSDVDIKNGELVNFTPLNDLSAFVKLAELKDLRFSELQNHIEIKDRVVNIPFMTIHTNALNVDVSGTQTFDNIVDYKIKLNLLELLGNKFRKTKYDADNTDKDANGALNLYLVMTGPASNPDIRYDKTEVKKKIKEGLQEQNKEVKAALNNEFSKQKQEQKAAKDWTPDQQPQFIEFNDSTSTQQSTQPQPQQPVQSTDTTSTRYKQKKAFKDFKNKLLHKNQPPPN